MKRALSIALMSASCLTVSNAAFAKELNVITSIQPVHSLVSAVMEGSGSEPVLFIKGAGSPHDYAMRPSDARALQKADVIFWIGEDLEGFLAKPISTLSNGALSVELHKADGIELLKPGEKGEHDHDDHAKHADEAHEEHEHEEHAHDEHGHEEHGDEHEKHADHDEHEEDGHHDHHHDVDMHVWLDPHNAEMMVKLIAAKLSDADPENKSLYSANAEKTIEKLEALDGEIREKLSDVRGEPFLTFHDAYGYFTGHYGLSYLGAISVNPERKPGAAKLKKIKHEIEHEKAACIFSEPQFQPKIIDVVAEGVPVGKGVLDPLGAELAPGKDAYFELMRNLAGSMVSCLEKHNH